MDCAHNECSHDKGRKATAKKKGGPKLVLSKKEKETLSKWLKNPYKPEDIFGEGDSLHDHEKLVRVNIPNFTGSGCPKVEQYQAVLKQSLNGKAAKAGTTDDSMTDNAKHNP